MAVLAALYFPRARPCRDVVALAPRRLLGWIIRHLLIAADRAMSAGGIGEHELVLVFGMLEIIIDAFMLHEATAHIQPPLPIPHPILPPRPPPRGRRRCPWA